MKKTTRCVERNTDVAQSERGGQRTQRATALGGWAADFEPPFWSRVWSRRRVDFEGAFGPGVMDVVPVGVCGTLARCSLASEARTRQAAWLASWLFGWSVVRCGWDGWYGRWRSSQIFPWCEPEPGAAQQRYINRRPAHTTPHIFATPAKTKDPPFSQSFRGVKLNGRWRRSRQNTAC